jgi:hypothetical protein
MDGKSDADVSENIGEYANSKTVIRNFVGGKEVYMDLDIKNIEDIGEEDTLAKN